MSKYDEIEVVEKGVDEIEVVEKFNPFHDAAGRFSDKNGFKTYSANPNTKAGAMAIARSAAAGHGNTANVHRESYGENIRQNANWMGRGNQGNPRWQGNATLHSRVEPGFGLRGASVVGSQWQQSNAKQGRTTQPSKQPTAQQAQQKPAPAKQPQAQQKPAQQPQQPQQAQQPQQPAPQQQGLANHVKNVQLRQSDKLAMVPRDSRGRSVNTDTVAKNHDQSRVAGKDISSTVDVTKIKGTDAPIDKIAKAQGWNKAPTVTDDLEVFQKAAKQSGQMLIRSIDDHGSKTAQSIWSDVLTNGDTPLGGSGGKWYGSGMYCVGAKTTGGATGRAFGQQISSAQQHSYGYGNKQMMATVHPSAKIASPTKAAQLQSEYNRLSYSDQRKYGGYGEYIASKGYDGAQWHTDSHPNPYITMYNKSAMIFYSGMASY